MDKIRTYCSAGAVDAEGNGIVNPDGSVACTANPFGGTGWAYLPDGIRYSQVDYDRTREGIALAGQYESPTGDVRASVQFIQSTYHNAWLENASHALLEGTYFGNPDFNPVESTILRPQIGSSPIVFSEATQLESGQLTQATGHWRGH